MFIGHFAVGLGLKRAAPTVSLGTLFLAAQWLDLLWPTLILTGVERVEIVRSRWPPLEFTHYPFSHGLVFVVIWAVLVGGAYFAARRTVRGALICAAAVASHWLLDLLVHAPDLPLAPGAAVRLGLGWWDHRWLATGVEFVLLAAGCVWFVRATQPRDRWGTMGFVVLVAVLSALQAGNLFGPPPPSAAAVAWVGEAQWLFVAWGYWLDGHREPRGNLLAVGSGSADKSCAVSGTFEEK